ncbi:hypothetical protein BJP40_06520 [Streptomyces sp. CC53]|uniref:hypothetical protein n=1 Tax=Streptomyces sp. CC53 TaxID=1906740 RepID=UPI0008DE3B78|nr:hypothetical protein [Streptomyces sp. CC53]OII61176.1 hypothetical protein BJP40_06520 [Streptomyces sp. CC53]
MTARDRFFTAYNDPGECYCGGTYCLSLEHLVDTLLREHAHELAERLREELGNCTSSYSWDSHSRRCREYHYREGDDAPRVPCDDYTSEDAADLIDPEVS